MDSFIGLPVEQRRTIYKYCQRKDLFALSLCSKQVNQEVEPLIWSRVCVNWKSLASPSLAIAKKLKHANSLEISTEHFHVNSEKDVGIAVNLNKVIQCVCSERLHRLIIRDLTVPGVLEMLAGRFSCIRKLELEGIGSFPFWNVRLHPQLTYLSISSCYYLRDENLAGIGLLSGLKYLFISRCSGLSCLSLEYISQVSSLSGLHFNDNSDSITDSDFANSLPKLRNLTDLCLDESSVDIEFFSKASLILPRLEELLLNFCELSESCFIHLSSAACMKILHLSDSGINDVALYYISNLALLEHLDISYNTITDVGVRYLSKLKNVRVLEFSSCNALTDQSLESVSQISSLEEIDMSSSGFTDSGMKFLSNLPSLKRIAYRDCGGSITEQGRRGAGLPEFEEELY